MTHPAQDSTEPRQLPVIAVVGRPNVGKSTLFNRMTRTRDALVANLPGLTRDRQYGTAIVRGHKCILIDTGGLSGNEAGIDMEMAKQSLAAVQEADLVLFMVDCRAGVTPGDNLIADLLRRESRSCLLLANKVDGVNVELQLPEFYELGLGDPQPLSASHGRYMQILEDRVLEELTARVPELVPPLVEDTPADDDDDSWPEDTWPADSSNNDDLALDGDSLADDDEDDDDASLDPNDTDLDDDEILNDGGDQDYPDADADDQERDLGPAVVGIVGRPNVGKSTLVNRLLGEERVVVFDQPGTTRDSVFVDLERGGRPYTLIDTAGVRRKGKVIETVEKFSVVKTLQAIAAAQVVVLMLDAREGVVDQDLHLLGYALDAGCALVIAVNKWDGMNHDERNDVRTELGRRLNFVPWAKVVFISALHGSGLKELFVAIDAAHAAGGTTAKTPDLTRILAHAVEAHQPAMIGGRRIKLRYAHMGGSFPPTIVIHGNQTDALQASYKRYLEKVFRDALSLAGTPVKLEFRTGSNPYKGKRNVLTDRQLRRRKRLRRHVKKR